MKKVVACPKSDKGQNYLLLMDGETLLYSDSVSISRIDRFWFV